MTPEGRIKAKLRRALDSLGRLYVFMPVQQGLGAATLDYLICARGRFVSIETKAPGKKLTPRQLITKAAIERAGGVVLVVDSDESLVRALDIIVLLGVP